MEYIHCFQNEAFDLVTKLRAEQEEAQGPMTPASFSLPHHSKPWVAMCPKYYCPMCIFIATATSPAASSVATAGNILPSPPVITAAADAINSNCRTTNAAPESANAAASTAASAVNRLGLSSIGYTPYIAVGSALTGAAR